MNETGFIRFYQATAGIECILYAACMAFFFRLFIDDKTIRKERNKTSFLIFVIYIAGYTLCLFPWFYGWMHIALTTGLLMLFSGYLGIARNFVFLLGVLFHCIRILSMMILNSLDFCLGEWFIREADTPERIFLGAACSHLLVTAIQFLLFSLLLRIAGRLLKKGDTVLHIRELCYLLLTPVTGILFAGIIVRLLAVANGDHIFRLYEQFPAFIVIVPAAAALFYIGILAAIAAFQRITGLQAEQKKYFVAEQQLNALQERIRQVEQFHDGIRQMKHEMRNHLANVKGLAESGHYEDLETYIARMDESMNRFELAVRTGNPVTDVIINDRYKAAAALGITFQCDFSYPSAASYNAYDIGIILGNLLRNAVEACGKEPAGRRYIRLSGRRKNKFFLIDIRNSFSGELILDPETCLPVSTKAKDPTKAAVSLHGIGLSNVRREAEKYRGTLDIAVRDGEFQATVLLQERRDTEKTLGKNICPDSGGEGRQDSD